MTADTIITAEEIPVPDDASSLPHQTWTIPGGRYVRRRPDFDPTRSCVEYYRSRKELLLMVPVR